jgi:hypothetical protein
MQTKLELPEDIAQGIESRWKDLPRAALESLPYFFSDVFDLSYEFWGDPAGAEESIYRGEVTSNTFSVSWLRQTTVVARDESCGRRARRGTKMD